MQSDTVAAAQRDKELARQRERAKAKERKQKRRSSGGPAGATARIAAGDEGWDVEDKATASRRKQRGGDNAPRPATAAAAASSAASAPAAQADEEDFIAFSKFADDESQAQMDDIALHQQEIVDQQAEEDEEAAAKHAAAAAEEAEEEEEAAAPEEEAAEEKEAAADDDQMQDEAADDDADEEEAEEEEAEALLASEDDEAEVSADEEIAVDVVDPDASDDEQNEAEEDEAPMASPLGSDDATAAAASFPATPASHSRKRGAASTPSSAAASLSVSSLPLSSFSFRASQVTFDASRAEYLLHFRAGERLVFRGSVAFSVEEGFIDVAGHTFGPRSVRTVVAVDGSASKSSTFHAHSWSWQPHALLSFAARAPPASSQAAHDEFVTILRLSACNSRFSPQRLAQLLVTPATGQSSGAKSLPRATAPTPAADPYAAAAAPVTLASPVASKRKSKKGSPAKSAATSASAAESFVRLHIPGFTPVLFSDDDFRAAAAMAADSAPAAAASAAASAPAVESSKSLYSALSFPPEWEETIKSMLLPALPTSNMPGGSAAVADEAEASESKSATLARKLHLKSLRAHIQSQGLRILVYGARNTGKSTLVSLLINAALNRVPRVLLLDLDVGQSTLNPPGMIALHEIDSPLLSTAAHVFAGRAPRQSTMLWSHFVGDVSVTSMDPALALAGVRTAVDLFARRFGPASGHTALAPLIVNTPGWITGLGLEMLQRAVADLVKPAYILETQINKDEEDQAASSSSSARKKKRAAEEEENILGELTHPHQHYTMRRSIDPAFATSVVAAASIVTAPRLRQLQLLAYFTSGASLPPALSLSVPLAFSAYASWLCACRPYLLSFRAARVEVQGLDPRVDYSPASVPAILNGSIVGLCCEATPAAKQREAAAGIVEITGRQSGLRLLARPPSAPFDAAASSACVPPVECLGLGLVRSVDLRLGLWAIVSPLSPAVMARVTLLQKGKMDTPNGAFGKDEYANTAAAAAVAAGPAARATTHGESVPYLSTSTLSASSGFGSREMSSRHNLQRKRLQ